MSSLTVPKPSKLAKKKADPNSNYWRDRADELWADLVRRRDGGCVICGDTRGINAHHLIDRSVKYLRHNLSNGVGLCPVHHKYSRACSAHAGMIAFVGWLNRWRPNQYAWAATAAQEYLLHERNKTIPGFNHQQDYEQLVQYRDRTYPKC
jgi:hypothetical protein